MAVDTGSKRLLRCDLGSRSSECDGSEGTKPKSTSQSTPLVNRPSPSDTGRSSESTYDFAVTEMPSLVTIERVQRRLKIERLYSGEVDGRLGSETAIAIRLYKIKNGLESSGFFDDETLHHLGVSIEIR